MSTPKSKKSDDDSVLQLQHTLEFNQSLPRAFAYLRDISRRKEFMTIVDETVITKKTKGNDLTGTRFKETTHFLGFDMNLEYEISEYVENKVIATSCDDGPFYPFMKIELVKGTGHTCTGQVSVKLKLGALKMMPKFIIKPTIDAIVTGILKKLTARVNEQ